MGGGSCVDLSADRGQLCQKGRRSEAADIVEAVNREGRFSGHGRSRASVGLSVPEAETVSEFAPISDPPDASIRMSLPSRRCKVLDDLRACGSLSRCKDTKRVWR
jgi:hypothetical protein